MGYDHIPARLFAYTDGCEDSWVNLFVVQKSIVALFFKHGFDEVIFARTAASMSYRKSARECMQLSIWQ